MIERQILRVVYSPFKAFEEIVKNPLPRGPLLIIALGVITQAIAGYVSSAKVYIQEAEGGIYVPLVTSNLIGGRVLSIAIDQALTLSLVWFIQTGAMLLVVKASGLSGSSWRVLFFVLGYTMMTTVVYTLVTAVLISTLPRVYLNWGVWNPTPENEQAAFEQRLIAYGSWFSSPVYKFAYYLSFVVEGWTAALAVIAIHALFGTTWQKAAVVAVSASVVTFLTKLVLLSL